MKKTLMVLTVMLLGISTVAFSQAKYGVKAGLVSANQKWGANGISISPDARIGGVFGVFAKFEVSEKIAIQPELLYVMKGSKMNMEIFDDEISGDVNLKFNYLSIPVMVK